MRVRVTCPLRPTESAELVLQALTNTFGPSSIKEFNGHLEILSENRDILNLLRNKIHEIRIIDVLRSRLLRNWTGTETAFKIDKQAALFGRTRILDDSEEDPPLGVITITIHNKNEMEFTELLNWLAPRTENGKIVG